MRKVKIGVTAEADVAALGIGKQCPDCGRIVADAGQGFALHKARYCRPGVVAGRAGSLADRLVRRHKMQRAIEGDSSLAVTWEGEKTHPTYQEKYLGCIVCPCEGHGAERKNRQDKAVGAQVEMKKFLTNRKIPWKIRKRGWQSYVGTHLLYGSETWDENPQDTRTWLRQREENAMQFMSEGKAHPGQGAYLQAEERHMRQKAMWFGHCVRMEDSQTVRQFVARKDFLKGVLDLPGDECLKRAHVRSKWEKVVNDDIAGQFEGIWPIPDVKESAREDQYVMFARRAYLWGKKTERKHKVRENVVTELPTQVGPPREGTGQSGVSPRPRGERRFIAWRSQNPEAQDSDAQVRNRGASDAQMDSSGCP